MLAKQFKHAHQSLQQRCFAAHVLPRSMVRCKELHVLLQMRCQEPKKAPGPPESFRLEFKPHDSYPPMESAESVCLGRGGRGVAQAGSTCSQLPRLCHWRTTASYMFGLDSGKGQCFQKGPRGPTARGLADIGPQARSAGRQSAHCSEHQGWIGLCEQDNDWSTPVKSFCLALGAARLLLSETVFASCGHHEFRSLRLYCEVCGLPPDFCQSGSREA